MSLRVFLVREPDTEWSRERRFAGWRDVPLSGEGRRQAEAAASALATVAPAAVYASPLRRTRETADLIAAAHGLPVVPEDAFRDLHVGAWEGLTLEEAADRFPAAGEAFRAAPDRFTAPGGESLLAVAERVDRGLQDLRQRHAADTVVLVTHAVVVRLVVLEALGLGPERLWSVDASPAGISELEYREDWVTVHRMNTLTHVAAPAAVVAP
jgi:broad specificity phosphatase PhoE